jgi:hypothetical protein
MSSEAKTEVPGAVVVASAVEGLPVLLEKTVIKQDQDHIRVSLVKLDTAIHANAVQCLLHAQKHGDTSLMRRLLVDIIDAKSGYRRQGLIGWMRMFSPMELKGDIINLTGMLNGERRPFNIEEANKTPFWSISKLNEMIAERPVFRDNLTSKIERAQREFKAAVDNTLIENGKVVGPKDIKKPFYNGIHLDKMEDAFDKIEGILNELSTWSDSTKDIVTNRENLKKAELAVAAEQSS